jgi:hypothetical protein
MPSVAPQDVQEVPDVPVGAEIPPPNANASLMLQPPLHDRCHCRVKTLPGGRQIWETSNNACPDCKQAGELFNAHQASIFGI